MEYLLGLDGRRAKKKGKKIVVKNRVKSAKKVKAMSAKEQVDAQIKQIESMITAKDNTIRKYEEAINNGTTAQFVQELLENTKASRSKLETRLNKWKEKSAKLQGFLEGLEEVDGFDGEETILM